MDAKAEAIAWIRAGWERAWALRRDSFSLLHIFSIGVSAEGFQELGAAFVQHGALKIWELQETQRKFATNVSPFNC